MKISQNTISLLQSFNQINSNLLVRPGNRLITRSATGSSQARATVDETFPTQFAIYDLSQFLGLLGVSTDPDIDFGQKNMTIKSSNGGEIEFFYADESLINAPPDSEVNVEPTFTFTLTNNDIQVIQKTSAIVSATMLSVIGEKNKVMLKINDPKNTTSNSYKKELGTTDQQFLARMTIDNFRAIVADTYDVQVGNAVGKGGHKVPVFHFTSTTRKLTYLIAADNTSKI